MFLASGPVHLLRQPCELARRSNDSQPVPRSGGRCPTSSVLSVRLCGLLLQLEVAAALLLFSVLGRLRASGLVEVLQAVFEESIRIFYFLETIY